jgi:hypothetical protein
MIYNLTHHFDLLSLDIWNNGFLARNLKRHFVLLFGYQHFQENESSVSDL